MPPASPTEKADSEASHILITESLRAKFQTTQIELVASLDAPSLYFKNKPANSLLVIQSISR